MTRRLLAVILLPPLYLVCAIAALFVRWWTGRELFEEWRNDPRDV